MVLLILTSSSVGFLEAYKLRLRVEYLEHFLQFILAVQAEIQFSAFPVRQLIVRHSGELKVCALCEQFCVQGEAFPSAWKKATMQGAKGNGLTKKEIQMIADFGAGLGSSDMAGQISYCELAAQRFRTQLEEARQEKGKKSKLYAMLGIFSGTAAALVIS